MFLHEKTLLNTVINLPSSSDDALEVAIVDSESVCCRFELKFPTMKKR